MKHFITAFIFTLALGFLPIAPVIGQTPDGQTPAEETVCDPLKADGITKGLYGLCVAFCEAQDHANIGIPLSEAEIEALEEGAPSGRILTNYNKKKQASDPGMPCIVLAEEGPCPCWTPSQFTAIAEGDGVDCVFLGPPPPFLAVIGTGTIGGMGGDDTTHAAVASSLFGLCAYEPPGPNNSLTLSVGEGLITPDEVTACYDEVVAKCDELGLPAP